MEFDIYLVQRIDGRRPYVGESAVRLGTVTVHPEMLPPDMTPLRHATEVINKHMPRSYSHKD